jgi:hypothetical protein
MAYGQKYEARTGFYLAHDISRLPIGAKVFANPPHITQCPPAEVDTARLPEIHEFLASLASDTEPIALRSLGQAFFGRRDDPTLVTQFDKPKALDQFHKRLIRGLAKAGCDFIGLEYALEGYNPHSEAVLLDPGVEVTMDNLTFFTECRTPRFNGLDEITARYEFGVLAG